MNNIQNKKSKLTNSLTKQKNLEKMKQERNHINSISSNNNNTIDISRSNTKYCIRTKWII